MSLDDIVQALNELHLSHHFGTVLQRSGMETRFTRSLVNVSQKRLENALRDILMAIQEANGLSPARTGEASRGKNEAWRRRRLCSSSAVGW